MDAIKKEWIEFWKKLARMLDGGIPLVPALETIRKEISQRAIAETCRVFIEELNKGKTLGEAMEGMPSCFPSSMVMVIKTGELSGTLETAALNVAAGIEEGSFLPGTLEVVAVESGGDRADSGALRTVMQIIAKAVQWKATDIHIESLPEGVRLRYRVDGVLTNDPDLKLTPEQYAMLSHRIKIMANLNIAEKRLPQDGRALITIDNHPLDLRVSYLPLAEGESVVVRILCKGILPAMEQIFKADHLATVRRWLKRSHGLLIVSGMVGSGKTTTLYSLLKSFDSTRHKIMTVEDPVEYLMEGVCQQRIRPEIGLTFPAALRAIYRQDPDIIMAGEIRDLEAVSLLAQAALTGHLVMASLHTDGGVQAVQRLVDIGLEPFIVSSILIGVISQRLFRLICQNCKEEIKPEPWMRALFPKGEMPKLFRGKGCEHCHGMGYRGRGAIHELFEPGEEFIRKLTREVSGAELQAEAVRAGLVTLRAEALAKVTEGVTTLEEIRTIISDLK